MVLEVEKKALSLEERDARSEFRNELILEAENPRRKGDVPEVLNEIVLLERSSGDKRMYKNRDFDHDRLRMTLVFKARPRYRKTVRLTPKENSLLTVFEEKPNEDRSKNELCKKSSDRESSWDSVRRDVFHLRRKIELDPKNPEFIVTVGKDSGGGYRFVESYRENSAIPELVSVENNFKERIYLHSAFTYDLDGRTVLANGKVTTLGLYEGKLLDLLVANTGNIVTYEMLKDVWGNKEVNLLSVLRRHISTLRDVLEQGKKEGEFQYLLNVRGEGYKLVDPNTIGKPKKQLEGITVSDKSLEEEGTVYDHQLFFHNREYNNVVVKETGREISLTPTENKLLSVLEEKPNGLRGTTELCERVFGERYPLYNVRKHIGRLRKKIEPDPKHPTIIKSYPEGGYIFIDSSTETSDDLKEEVYAYSGFKFNPGKRIVIVGKREIYLSSTEIELLKLFVRNPKRIIKHKSLTDVLENKGDMGDEDIKEKLKIYIKSLRRKLEPEKRGKDYGYLVSVRGVGYKLIDPERIPVTVFERTLSA